MNFKLLELSKFTNQYGGLGVAEGDDGKRYLRMEDAVGFTYYGPLEDQHIEALDLLDSLPKFMQTDEWGNPESVE